MSEQQYECADRSTFKHESLQDNATILAYLDALKEGFANGTFSLSSGDREMILEPKGLIKLDVEAKRREGAYKVSLKFTWRDENEPTSDDPLQINSR